MAERVPFHIIMCQVWLLPVWQIEIEIELELELEWTKYVSHMEGSWPLWQYFTGLPAKDRTRVRTRAWARVRVRARARVSQFCVRYGSLLATLSTFYQSGSWSSQVIKTCSHLFDTKLIPTYSCLLDITTFFKASFSFLNQAKTTFFRISRGTPAEVWISRILVWEIVPRRCRYEMRKRDSWQKPSAFTKSDKSSSSSAPGTKLLHALQSTRHFALQDTAVSGEEHCKTLHQTLQ